MQAREQAPLVRVHAVAFIMGLEAGPGAPIECALHPATPRHRLPIVGESGDGLAPELSLAWALVVEQQVGLHHGEAQEMILAGTPVQLILEVRGALVRRQVGGQRGAPVTEQMHPQAQHLSVEAAVEVFAALHARDQSEALGIELPGFLQVYIQPKGISSSAAACSPQAILARVWMGGKLAETEALQKALSVVAEIAPFSVGLQTQGIGVDPDTLRVVSRLHGLGPGEQQ